MVLTVWGLSGLVRLHSGLVGVVLWLLRRRSIFLMKGLIRRLLFCISRLRPPCLLYCSTCCKTADSSRYSWFTFSSLRSYNSLMSRMCLISVSRFFISCSSFRWYSMRCFCSCALNCVIWDLISSFQLSWVSKNCESSYFPRI
jgi:hypothetical protein